jgi:hypothetical protein
MDQLHAPLPLQVWLPGHSSAPLPDGRGEHVPSNPASPQLTQTPVQVVSQQKPSTHIPLAQSDAPLGHGLPGPHPGQVPPPPQSTSTSLPFITSSEQLWQVSPEQTYPASQVTLPESTQVPLPLQVSAEVSVEPMQLEAEHSVPEG